MSGDALAPLSSPSDLLQEVRALEDAGKLVEAIDLLTAVNRRRPDPKLEFRLTRLRYAAFPTLPAVSGLASWPPPVPDSAPGLDESLPIPEVSGEDLSVAALRRGVLGHGSLLVRNLIDRSGRGQNGRDACLGM